MLFPPSSGEDGYAAAAATKPAQQLTFLDLVLVNMAAGLRKLRRISLFAMRVQHLAAQGERRWAHRRGWAVVVLPSRAHRYPTLAAHLRSYRPPPDLGDIVPVLLAPDAAERYAHPLSLPEVCIFLLHSLLRRFQQAHPLSPPLASAALLQHRQVLSLHLLDLALRGYRCFPAWPLSSRYLSLYGRRGMGEGVGGRGGAETSAEIALAALASLLPSPCLP